MNAVGSIIIPVVIVLGLAVVAAAVVFFGIKLRSGEVRSISFRTLLTAYFYLLSIAGLIVMLVGLSGLLNAGLSVPLGRDFSYFAPPVSKAPIPPAPAGGPATVAPPTQDQQQEDARRQQERQFRESLLQGISMLMVGGVVWVIHTLGRRRTETPEERETGFLHIAFLVILLLISSLVGVITLSSGIFEALRFYLIEPATQFEFRNPPGPNVSTALVFTPTWAYCLILLLRRVRQRQPG